MKYTPENITSLGKDEVFVFGSNLAGNHAGGAARVARERFGAIPGQGVGMQGQSYAIPTMQGGVETIKPYVDDFIKLAREWDQTTFYVTRIGCGIAGFKDEEIAPLFAEAMELYNVRLPESFAKVIYKLEDSYLPNWTKHYSSYDMMLDLLLAANRIYKYSVRDKDIAISRLEEKLGWYLRGISYTCDYKAFQNGDEVPTHEWIDRELQKAAGKMESEGLLMAPVQRFSLVLEAEIARLLLDITDAKPELFPIGWHNLESFGYSVVCILTGRWNCGDNRYLAEDLEKALQPVKKALSENWESLCTDGYLDEKKVIAFLSDPTLWQEWRRTANHDKALYRWFDMLLMQMSMKPDGAYRRGISPAKREYFVPRHNMNAPVFERIEGRVHFPNFQLKKAFIEGLDYDSRLLK